MSRGLQGCFRAAFVIVVAASALGVAACAKNGQAANDDDLSPSGVTSGDPSSGESEAGTSNPDPHAATTSDGSSTNNQGHGSPCDTLDGGTVYCVERGKVFLTSATITYPPGMPSPLPAMGIGRRGTGAFGADDPFTCVATPGVHATKATNSPTGKDCEVFFDDTLPGTTTGTASYAVTVLPDAPAGLYEIGFLANYGTTIAEKPFYFKIQ